MKYLHTMIRISNVDESLRFFCEGLGLVEQKRIENENGRFTLIFLSAPGDESSSN
jgi:lactoylglutathione lyase